MPASLIRDTPALEWAAGSRVTVRLDPFTLPTGRVLGSYSGYTLAIREDPEWPRTGADLAAAGRADPIADGWAVVATAEGSLVGDVPTFTLTVPSGAGVRRYAVDVWGVVGGGPVQLVRATWLTVGARVVAPS